MRTFLALASHQARNSRSSLLVALAVNALVLAAVHAQFALPVAVSEAALAAVGVLAALWTLYFASDAFAESLANGRMATLALLPVRPLTLWTSRVAFAVAASLGVAMVTIAAEILLQIAFGSEASLAHFVAGIEGVTGSGTLHLHLACVLLACIALLASALVESALAAALATLLAGAGLAWGWTRLEPWLAAVDMGPRERQLELLVGAASTFVLGTCAYAFARGQRRFGNRWVRVRSAAAVLVATGVVTGVATGGERFRRTLNALERPETRLFQGVSSPDGRHLAIETVATAYDRGTLAVWLLDLGTGEYEALARPAQLLSDFHNLCPMPWDGENGLRVIRLEGREAGELEDVARVSVADGSARIETDGKRLPRVSRLFPDWAEIRQTLPDRAGNRSTTVLWKERGLELVLRGAPRETAIGHTILPAPRPGRVLVLARGAGRVELHDLESGSTETVLEGLGEKAYFLRPSPDGSAVLVHSAEATHVLDASDGRPLHAPIPRGEASAEWVHTGGAQRVLVVSNRSHERVVDLDTGREFPLERDRAHHLLVRVADAGYAFVNRAGDLVLVDLDGRPARVLLNR